MGPGRAEICSVLGLVGTLGSGFGAGLNSVLGCGVNSGSGSRLGSGWNSGTGSCLEWSKRDRRTVSASTLRIASSSASRSRVISASSSGGSMPRSCVTSAVRARS
jgi:hypothetical protein